MFQQLPPLFQAGPGEIPPPGPGAAVGVYAPLEYIHPRLVGVAENDQGNSLLLDNLLRCPHQVVAEPPADALASLQEGRLDLSSSGGASAKTKNPRPEVSDGLANPGQVPRPSAERQVPPFPLPSVDRGAR